MALSRAQRIENISECATLLSKYDEARIDLILEQFDAPTARSWDREDLNAYAVAMLKNQGDTTLEELHQYLTSQVSGARTGQSPWTSDRLRLFCSHLATHKAQVGEVADVLARNGLDHFVAHEAIEPSREWQQVIEAALADCDAMVVFLHDGFVASPWCDQEVGWALGRGIPVLPLNYGTHPHGFLGKLQDHPCVGRSAHQVGAFITEWLAGIPRVHSRLSASLAAAFRDSGSFQRTRDLVPLLERVQVYTEDQLGILERAARENSQISLANISGVQGPEWVAAFVASRRAPTAEPVWSSEPPF